MLVQGGLKTKLCRCAKVQTVSTQMLMVSLVSSSSYMYLVVIEVDYSCFFSQF